jgi:hypothetical protein
MTDETPIPFDPTIVRVTPVARDLTEISVSPCQRRNPDDYRHRIPERLGRATVDDWCWRNGMFVFVLRADPHDPKALEDKSQLAELLALILDAEY